MPRPIDLLERLMNNMRSIALKTWFNGLITLFREITGRRRFFNDGRKHENYE